ncbi:MULTISPECIES: putative quinol monooxygenase [Sandaracinus]|uniref:putative quinol monooxygenase n=1 Tax=Sandaracinus TaxID=1055688 RepID=UPI0019D42174|nr:MULTISPECIES: antibiotic biosynthesis monooxygenase [Sandaracinus]QRN75733.1 Hypothetical protein MSR10575_88200 [Sandaracinus sp.]UJR87217.1 Hypothetical protein I5071_080 [Sandaracinus amylolyticus]
MVTPRETHDTVICTYRPKPEREAEFRRLLERHWPALRELGLVRPSAPLHFRGEEEGRPFYVEIFEWRDADAVEAAHQSPEIMRLWEPMETLCEERDGRPAMSFPHVERLALVR